MAFDITPYIDKKPSEVRQLIRQGVIDFPTAGMCRGYAQANLVILPPEYADDFEEYTRKNPFPCPSAGNHSRHPRDPRHGTGRKHCHRHPPLPSV